MKRIMMSCCLILLFILTSCQNNADGGMVETEKTIGTVTQVSITETTQTSTETQQSESVNPVVDGQDNGVNLDQLGYRKQSEKIAVFHGQGVGSIFRVVRVDDGKVVYEGAIEGAKNNLTADEINAYGNFSELTQSGIYRIVTDTVESHEFQIGNDIYDAAFNDALKMLFMQRCGEPLLQEQAGDFAHDTCHAGLATVFGTETKIDVSGGWHDAGDYGRYVVPGAKTIADLLLAYAAKPEKFTDDTGMPESNNGVSDILDEVRYELEWLLKMQETTGGVYHKVTAANFPGVVMPEDEVSALVVSPVSDAATGAFAAVMAMGYESYFNIDATFANTCLIAARSAWDYMGTKKGFRGFTNPSGISTGEYGDGNVSDEYFWASVALYKATKETQYHEAAKGAYRNIKLGLGWADVGTYGAYDYLRLGIEERDEPLYDKVRSDFLRLADTVVTKSMTDGYFISVGNTYPWGSNMIVANNAMLLQMANDIAPKAAYLTVAAHHIHYLFGANPMATSYVTGHGTVSPISTHHRPSQFLGQTLPGMLVGGPNSFLQDPYAKAVLAGSPPAKCYVDAQESYSCNEVAIYWNSPLIYILTKQ